MMTGFEGFRNENSDRIEASKRKFLIFNIRCLKHLEQLDASLGLRLCFCGYVSVCMSVFTSLIPSLQTSLSSLLPKSLPPHISLSCYFERSYIYIFPVLFINSSRLLFGRAWAGSASE